MNKLLEMNPIYFCAALGCFQLKVSLKVYLMLNLQTK